MQHGARAGRGADPAPGSHVAVPDAPGDAPPPDVPGPDADDAALLAASPFFDPVFYAGTAGCDSRPLAAARHYLRRGARRGLHPHPLFATEHVVAACPSLGEGGNPLATYIRQQRYDVATHPLFDLKAYRAASPAAAAHPLGPLGHYLEVGARQRLAPNDWYQPHEGEPRGLVDWVAARHREWLERRSRVPRSRTRHPPQPEPAPGSSAPGPGEPLVTVVVPAGADPRALERTVRSVLDQEQAAREVVVVADGTRRGVELRRELERWFPEAALVVVSYDGTAGERPSVGLNRAARRAAGDLLAWALPGDVWAPGRLRLLQAVCTEEDAPAASDVMRVVRPGTHDVYAAASAALGPPASPVTVELARLVVRRSAFWAVGGFDEQLPGSWETDLVLRLASRFPVRSVAAVGTSREEVVEALAAEVEPSVLDHARVSTWADVAFNRCAVDWDALSRRDQRTDLVTVVVSAAGWRQAVACVRQVVTAGAPAGRSCECLVVDDGSQSLTSVVLSSLEARFDDVRVVHIPASVGAALSSNLALRQANGSVVVWLAGDVRVQPRWLDPLVGALESPDVLGAQALVTGASGSIDCAGFAFPSCGGLPYEFLQGFPAADAAGLDDVPLMALSRAATAMRYDDLVALQGFDPLFRGGLEDVDLCLRLLHTRRGRFVLAPESRVSRPARSRGGRRTPPAQTPERGAGSVPALERELFLDRWEARSPRDDRRLWASRGFDVHGYATVPSEGVERRLCAPQPVLSRARVSVHENAAPAALGPEGRVTGRGATGALGRHPLRAQPGGRAARARPAGRRRPP